MVTTEMTRKKLGNIISADPAELFEIAELMFDQGKSIIVEASGGDMHPFLRRGVDRAEIFRVAAGDIRVSDIVFVKHGGGYTLRRVCKIDGNGFYVTGDAWTHPDGPYCKGDIAGKVTSIYRKEKRVLCSSPVMRALVLAWRVARPVRPYAVYAYNKLRNAGARSDDEDYALVRRHEHR